MKTKIEKIRQDDTAMAVLIGIAVLASLYLIINFTPFILIIPLALFGLFFSTPLWMFYLAYRALNVLEGRNRYDRD